MKLEKHYSKLTPDERFALMVRALERDDDEEIIRLRDTAPRESFTWIEQAYCERIEAARLLAQVARETLLTEGLKLFVAAVALQTLYHGGKKIDEKLKLELEGAAHIIMSRATTDIVTLWRALERFCDGLNITRSGLLRLTPGASDKLLTTIVEMAEELAAMDNGYTPEEAVEMTASELWKAWRKMVI